MPMSNLDSILYLPNNLRHGIASLQLGKQSGMLLKPLKLQVIA